MLKNAENIRGAVGRVKPVIAFSILTLALYSSIKLWFVMGVELGKDEAVYTYWGQHLDASYALLPFAVIGIFHGLAPGIEWVLRLGSILVGSLCLVLMFRFCGLFGLPRSMRLWATLALASSHWFWHTTSFLHPDGFLVACWMLVLLVARKAQCEPSPVAYVKIGVAAGMTLLCKYSGLFLVGGLMLWIGFCTNHEKPDKERWRRLLWVSVPMFIIASPLIYTQLESGFYLPMTLSTLSQIDRSGNPLLRLLLFFANPLLFVSPILLYLLYRTLIRTAREVTTDRSLLLPLLPALVLIGAFGLFALTRGQIKGNWILPAFLGLIPLTFKRLVLSSKSALLLGLLFLTASVQTLGIGTGLKFPALFAHLGAATENRLNATYRHLVAQPDLRREVAFTWTERLCEYWGWRNLAAELDALAGSDLSLTPVVSTHYGLTFALEYYGDSGRISYTVDDNRFRHLTDLFMQSGSQLPRQLLFVVRRGSDIPATLRSHYVTTEKVGTLMRSADGCSPIRYDVDLFSR